MTSTKLWAMVAVGAVMFAGTSTTVAAQSQVTDRGAITGGSTVDWLNAPSSTSAFSFSIGSTSVNVSTDGAFIRHINGVTFQAGFDFLEPVMLARGGSSITFDFSSPITGFATQGWFNWVGTSTFFIDAFHGDALTATYAVSGIGGSADASTPAPVLGLVDARGFDRIVLRGEHSRVNEFAINHLTLGSMAEVTVTPEPGTIALLATGLVVLGGFTASRRRREAAVRG